MNKFSRFLTAIDDAHDDFSRNGDAFARIMQQRMPIDDPALASGNISDLLNAATRAIAIQSAADFVAMNQPADVITVPAGPVVSSTTSAATDAAATTAIEQE